MDLDIPLRQYAAQRVAARRLDAERVAERAGFPYIVYVNAICGRHAINGRVPEESCMRASLQQCRNV
jgi:hypothetical protein